MNALSKNIQHADSLCNQGANLPGLDWETLRDLLSIPASAQKTALKLACLLAGEANTETTVQKASAELKTNEINILEAVSHMPTLFRLSHAGHRVHLRMPGNDPRLLSPRQQRELQRANDRSRRAKEKQNAQQAADSADTPSNEIMRMLETLGIPKTEARSFSHWLASTYTPQAALDATRIAVDAKPAAPKPYITAILRNASAGGITAKPKMIPQRTEPSGERSTIFIGWSNTTPRVKFYRLPTGLLKTEPPLPNEKIPSLAEDPGFQVKA
jgi:hypothetical protein